MNDNITQKILQRHVDSGERVTHGAASDSALNVLLCVASKHYAEMPPHVRKHKTAELLVQLIVELKKSQTLFKDINDYLNINDQTNIGHGSILHREIKEILNT